MPPKAGTENQSPAQDTSLWWTREESASFLRVSAQTLRNYEKKGFLASQRAVRGDALGRKQEILLYDPREVARVRDVIREQSKKAAHLTTKDTSSWVTRNECIDAMSISGQTLRNYESQGILHPERVLRADKRGHMQVVVVYDPKEVARLPRGVAKSFSREPGEIAARCYELFEQGKTFTEIVMSLRQTSDTVHALHERWLDDGGSRLVITPEAKDALEKLVGPFSDVADLIHHVTALSYAQKKTTDGNG
jgi:DNA-binding transcriptional MerR regulator